MSVVDTQMRVGHKSKRQSWAGCKVHQVELLESELITQVESRPANEYDADTALGLIERQQESVGLLPKDFCAMGHTARPTCAPIWGNWEWRWWPNSGR